MLAVQNTIIDDTIKPAVKWIHGKPRQKLMPTDLHAILQLAFAGFLADWAKINNYNRGRVGTEWRFLIPPNLYETESLVPDVAFLSIYFDLPKSDRTYPAVAPDIAVEILSPDDEMSEVDSGRKFLLWWGVKLVLIVDPKKRTLLYHETDQYFGQLSEHDTFQSSTFPTLTIPLQPMFAELDDPI